MSLPTHLTSGFDAAEASQLIELCRRTEALFQHTPSGMTPVVPSATAIADRSAAYRAQYQDLWEYVHAFSDAQYGVHVLLTKRVNHQQYAVTFVGALPPAGKAQAPAPMKGTAKPAVQQIAITRGGGNERAVAATTVTAAQDNPQRVIQQGAQPVPVSISYPPLANEQEPPPTGARVHGVWQAIFEQLRPELEFFFDILVNPKFARPLLLDLLYSKADDRASKIAAIGAAIRLRHNQAAGEAVVTALSQTLAELDAGQKEPSSVTLDQVIAETIGEEPMSADLSAGIELYVGGHCVGGCVAALCALYVKRKWATRIDFPNFALKLYNFGSPKIGNQAFVDYYNRRLQGYSYRIQNLLDGATYEPQLQAPFPYNLQLLLPGVDYVRHGDAYYLAYEHIDEARLFSGWGKTTFTFNFMGSARPLIPLPFAHNPAGYQELLHDADERQVPLQQLLPPALQQLGEQSYRLYAKWQEEASKMQQFLQQRQGPPHA